MRGAERRSSPGRTFFGTVAWLLVAGAVCAAPEQQIHRKLGELERLPSKFSFIVLGDTRTGDDVYQKIVTQAAARTPDLILNTGDQIARPGDRAQWRNFWRMSKVVTMPYFLTVGNHDANAAVDGSEDVYRDEVDLPGNELYYSFSVANSRFIVLDSCLREEEKRITGEQFRWLEDVLRRSKSSNTFIFVHHPLFPKEGRGKHAGRSLDAYPHERDRLHDLFVQYAVTAVFQGHDHVYFRQKVDGIPYITAGGGGAPLYAKDKDGGFHHYVHLTVDGKQVNGEVVDLDGNVRDRF